KVRDATGAEVPGPELLWLSGVSDLTGPVAEALARIATDGGVVLLEGVQPAFFKTLAALRERQKGAPPPVTVFEDFERRNYDGWTITGEAFGQAPSRGTEAGQQPVSGFAGRGLVNTFIAGDGPQGTATSKPFRIEKRYIGFLIGGGQHPKQTCINLRVDGKVVRTATGKNLEALEPASWDVADLVGKEAVIEIVDRHSGAWGHINIDQIVFSDIPPEGLLKQGTASDTAARALAVAFDAADAAGLAKEQDRLPSEPNAERLRLLQPMPERWLPDVATLLRGFREEGGYRAMVSTKNKLPLIIEGPLGKGRVILVLGSRLPWSWGSALLAASRGQPLKPGERLTPGHPGWGTMALAALEPNAAVLPAWSSPDRLADFLTRPGEAKSPAQAVKDDPAGPGATSPGTAPGTTANAALAVPFQLQPGEERTVTFVIAWHFPNVQRFQHAGNLYGRRWPDAEAVVRYVARHIEPLWDRTRLYHQTVYESNLPEEFLDAMTSQSCILRGPTCWWSEDGYFGGFEGSYGCCPLNCTHVWNYAQAHARLFPEVGQNMRVSNFVTFLHPSGETSHREHGPHGAFIDGHCACIEAALREHQMSPDRRFLEKIWPGVKKSVDWLIEAIDKDRDGLPAGHQWNTYDTAVSGANTFIGSQYLSALAAAERMAQVMNDPQSAARWRAVRQAGMKNQNEKLWNGEYYFQIPEEKPARDYNNGCHADQLLGQWWAHMLGLGYLYPPERVKAALAAVMKHNFREHFAGFKQDPRRYVIDSEGGLLICTWPKNDRPKSFILYADEVWTGIEYSTAGAMIYEGLIDEARKIVRTARARYDGRRRDGLNSGPGGNPYNELECGKFYARAMSAWSLLVASQGLVLDGPEGVLGFKPKWQPADHRSFFTAPEGWGLFVQRRDGNQQRDSIEVRHGRLRLRELVFELPEGAGQVAATVTASGRPVNVALRRDGAEVRLALAQETVVPEGETVDVSLRW
ncbi:MAG: non-lysosomal glucosylceramidase, partial [Thermoguttaceae bacterium]|nr:non-lysosomal glucosylceramidase [Thermoguttaceae bacterium]